MHLLFLSGLKILLQHMHNYASYECFLLGRDFAVTLYIHSKVFSITKPIYISQFTLTRAETNAHVNHTIRYFFKEKRRQQKMTVDAAQKLVIAINTLKFSR